MKAPISTVLLREQLIRFWPLALLSLMFYLLVVVMPIGHFGFDESYIMNINVMNRIVTDMMDLLAMRNIFMNFATVVIPFVTAMCVFSYAFSRKAAIAFHSFPINKSQLFITHIVAGLILMLVPLFLLCLVLLMPPIQVLPGFYVHGQWVHNIKWYRVTLFPNGLIFGDTINTFPIVAGFFMRSVVSYVFYFILFTLAISVSGNRIIAILLSGVIPFIPVGFYGLGRTVIENYVLGFPSRLRPFESLYFVMYYTNPTSWQHFFHYRTHIGSSITPLAQPLHPYFISYILIGLAMLVIAYLCFHKRRQEKIGDSIVFLPLKKILIFLVSMGGMIVIGTVLTFATQSGRIGLYIGYVIGFAISFFIAQMFAETSLQVWSKIRLLPVFGGIMLGLYLLMFGITHIGLRSYINYVPQRENISGVLLDTWNGIPLDIPTDLFVTDQQSIDIVVEFHERILADQEVNRMRWRYIGGSLLYFSGGHLPGRQVSPQFIAYRMDDGRIVRRFYLVPVEWLGSFWENNWDLYEQAQLHSSISWEELLAELYP